MSQTNINPSHAGPPPSKPAPVSHSPRSPPPEKAAPIKRRGPWHSIFERTFGGIISEMVSSTFINFSSYLTQLLADKRKDTYIKKTMRLHIGYGGEVGCGIGGTEEKGAHFGYPGPVVHNLGDFSMSHYRMSNKPKKKQKKENLLYSKFVINGMPSFERMIDMCKTLIRGFYVYGGNQDGFIAALKKYFPLSVRESVLDLENIRVNHSKQSDIAAIKVTIPWDAEKMASNYPKCWARVQKIKKFSHQLMDESGTHVFLTVVLNTNGVFVFGMIYQNKMVLCKIVQRKHKPTDKKESTLHVPLANLNGAGPRTVDVNLTSKQTFQCHTNMSISTVYGMATFQLPWIHGKMTITPKAMGGASAHLKIEEIQERSMAETMFSMILPFQQFRELQLKYYDVRLNLGKSSLSRNPIRTDSETHAIGGSQKLKDRYLLTIDGLVRTPPFPSCLANIVSDLIIDSWEERIKWFRDTSQTFGMDLRGIHEEQMRAKEALSSNDHKEEADEKIEIVLKNYEK